MPPSKVWPVMVSIVMVSDGCPRARGGTYGGLVGYVHLWTYSARLVKSVGWSGVQAGDSGVRSKGRFKRETMTVAQ